MLRTSLILLLFIANFCYSQQEIQIEVISKEPDLRNKANEFIKTHPGLCKNFNYDHCDTIRYEGGRNVRENQYSLLAVNKAKVNTAKDENDASRYDFMLTIKRIKGEYYVVRMYCNTPDADWKLAWEEYPK